MKACPLVTQICSPVNPVSRTLPFRSKAHIGVSQRRWVLKSFPSSQSVHTLVRIPLEVLHEIGCHVFLMPL